MGKSSTAAKAEGERRTSVLPIADPDAPATLGNSAKVVGWGLVFWGAEQIAGAVLETRSMATLVVQAAIAEWGGSRIGIPWTEGREKERASVLRRAGVGAGIGAGAAVLALAGAVAVHAASRFPTALSVEALLLGLVVAALGAVRDELLLRGVVLRATRGLLPVWAQILSAGATTAAASLGAGAVPALVLAEGLRGTALAGAWIRGRGAVVPCAANAAWMWCFGAVTRGALLDLRFAGEPEASLPALVVLAVAAALALAVALRVPGDSPRPSD